MIGTFWNLCRACPSMPIDKNRSEYRSTYQWYEYTGPRQEVVKQAPQLTSPTKPEEHGLKGGIQATLININKNDGVKRTKENAVDGNVQPEVNIKKNPIYGKKDIDYSLERDNAPDNKTTENSAVRLRSRNDKRDYAPSRRSKSEGPPGASNKRSYYTAYGSPSPDYVDVADYDTEYVLISNYPEDYDSTDTAGIPVKGVRGNTEYRLQFAWPKSNKNEAQEEQKAAAGGSSSRRSVFMAPTGHERPPVPVHKKRFLDTDKKDGGAELEPLVDQNGECDHEEKRDKNQNNDRLEFYSEYTKKFRPFSQYDYIAGKFLARDNNVTPASSLTAGSWYTEVVELRKKAGEYKHRGWGTELVPQHLAEVYNKQIALWEHVSRRSSLSALTLATTTQKPRALTKEEKGKENSRKLAPHRLRDSSRQTSVDRSASVARKKTEKNEEIKRHSAKYKDGATKGVEKPVSSAGTPTSTSISSGRSQAVGGSPKKYPSSRPPSSGSPKKVINQEARARPTTLATNAQSRIKRDTSASAKKRELLKHKISPASGKIVDPSQKKDVEIKPSERDKTDSVHAGNEKGADEVIEVERIVKSPPEPTRVKSPEQLMMRSPEPVNWTVPLDTGKTFTVTQNIHDGDLYHHRPPSESKILSTLHHGPHSLDSQNITSHKSQDDTPPLSLEKFDDTPPLSLEKFDDASIEKDSNLNGTDDKSLTLTKSVEEHPPKVTSTNGKYSDETTSEEKHSPVSEHSDSNVKSPVDQESLPSVPVTGISSAEVDSARDRFEQFWSKPKYEMNGKESSM